MRNGKFSKSRACLCPQTLREPFITTSCSESQGCSQHEDGILGDFIRNRERSVYFCFCFFN